MMRYYETVKAKLNTIAIESGNLIYCTDTLETYCDTSTGQRIRTGDIVYLETESNRTVLIAPLTGKIYFVKETNKLYCHNGTDWVNLNSGVQVIDDLISTNSNAALSANQGKVLDGKITNLSNTKSAVEIVRW